LFLILISRILSSFLSLHISRISHWWMKTRTNCSTYS
jgi:hypothetical protein